MKPDGVATTPAEPPEDVVEPVPEAAANEELVQQDPSPSSTQPENDENQGKQEGAPSTLPPPGKEVNGKFSKPKDKTKAPVKTKPGTAGIKSTTTAGAASRFATAESRAANGVKKTASVGVNKKPASMTSELKKSAPVGASSQVKKVPTATTVASRTQVKVAEQKAVGSARPISSTSSVTRKPAAATSQALSNKSAVGGSNVPVKPKTAAPRTTSAPAAKTSIPDGSKAAATSKTTRSTVATASRTAPSSAPVRLKTTTNKSTALRTTVSATKSASAQPTTVAAKKDITTTNSSAARKLLSSTTTRSPAPKAAKPEPPKPTAVAKRLPTDPKTFPQKMIKAQVPTRKVPPSPRNISSRTASGRLAAELGNHKQGVSSNLVSATVQTAKPTQSVLPLVIKGKPSEEQSLGSVEPSAVIETTATIAPVESVIEAQALEEGQAEVPAQDPTNVDTVSIRETRDAEPFTTQSVANELVPCEMVHDYVIVVAPTAQEMNGQERATTSPCEVPVTLQMPPRDLEVVEKQELIIRNFEEEEEEKEGSQQVSVSDMSGTQPTEESRPGSAGLAGSLYRAGGLPSEFDSEDVSCSQHGASELSAPGVLEGTESMDDLGEASLKGADEGASAGSPDFEKFPDILVNEDVDEDDDEDRVDDMDVGSEMTEDPHRQYNDDEDEDVEMASEGVTESGLESYGNADEDDLTEDYRLDNLNRMQPLSIVSALSSADAWMQSLQPDPALVSSPASFPWQTNPELPATEACLDIEGAKTDLSSQTSAVISFPSLEPAVEVGMDHKQGPCLPCMSQSSALLDPELTDYAHSGASTINDLKDHSSLENQKQLLSVSQIPVAECGSDNAGSEHEEPETPPEDDILPGVSTEIKSSSSPHSTAIGDKVSDTEVNMQISDPTDPSSKDNECLNTQVAPSMSTLVEECEEGCVEMDGGGGSDTPQSATSAASYGFEGTTSNSNAQSTTESCIKSPGIFSLENEEQLPDETKDQSVVKELSLVPSDPLEDSDQQGECQLNSEQQYMHCGKVSEKLAETTSPKDTAPSEKGLDRSSSLEHQQDLDLDAPHPYYSTICEKTDRFLTGSDLCVEQEKGATKQHSGLRVDHVMRLPTELPPRMPKVGCNAQLRRLEQHQQQLAEIEQRREQQKLIPEKQKVEKEMKCNGKNGEREQEIESELKSREEKDGEFEEQRRHLLQLQIQQQQQELKQRQQIMQWQQELEQQTEQSKHQNSHPKNLSTVPLSPSGLCTIYEALETSDAEEENEDNEKEMVLKIKVEHVGSSEERSSISEAHTSLENPDTLQSQCTPPFSNYADDQNRFTHPVTTDGPPLSETSTTQTQSHSLDWSKKTDIVQQLINQTLLLNGDKCSPHLLIPDGAAGTLSPLKTSLWPNLPQMTPLSATVTSVSSYSAELSGSSPQGEWTVVELETHH